MFSINCAYAVILVTDFDCGGKWCQLSVCNVCKSLCLSVCHCFCIFELCTEVKSAILDFLVYDDLRYRNNHAFELRGQNVLSLVVLQVVNVRVDLSVCVQAMQLIKAVSMLLHFTPEEQKLIHDTLEWKMSWFGARPQLPDHGQTAKVIPPSY